jgi:FKBP-type peptidyl-prolyl cis-trans isomerase FklB
MRFSTLAPSAFAMSVALASLAPAMASAQAAAQPAPAPAAPGGLKDPAAQVSYAIGFNFGSQMKKDGVPIDPNVMVRGLQDAMSGAKAVLTDDQMSQVMTALQKTVMERRHAEAAQHAQALAATGAKNLADGAAYLKANAVKPGVNTTADGLQYEILTKGTGPKPKATDTVVCNYKGTLIDGKVFDASASHGGPATFPVGGVIKGWTEALQMMPVGSKWRLVLPAELAYGPDGAGSDIGPNSVLIFEVELVSIKAG